MGPLCHILAQLGDAARREDRPLPVIETDVDTARLLETMLMWEMSHDIMLPQDHPERAFGVVAMFDGVKIKGKKRESNHADRV